MNEQGNNKNLPYRQKHIDSEEISKIKKSDKNDKAQLNIEKIFIDDISGRDLDIPGSELDDEPENIWNEDEENNYYSIEGDGHNLLDEDKNDLQVSV